MSLKSIVSRRSALTLSGALGLGASLSLVTRGDEIKTPKKLQGIAELAAKVLAKFVFGSPQQEFVEAGWDFPHWFLNYYGFTPTSQPAEWFPTLSKGMANPATRVVAGSGVFQLFMPVLSEIENLPTESRELVSCDFALDQRAWVIAEPGIAESPMANLQVIYSLLEPDNSKRVFCVSIFAQKVTEGWKLLEINRRFIV